MENPNPPAQQAEPAEVSNSSPAITGSPAVSLDTAGLSPEVAQALTEAYAAYSHAAPSETVAPAEVPAASSAAPDSTLETDDDGDDEPEATADPDAPKLSRREREAQRLKAEVDTAVAAALAADQARQASEAALAQRRAADEQLAATVAQYIGNPEDENALIEAVSNGDFEAADKLKTLRTERVKAGQFYQLATQQVYAGLLTKIEATKSLNGVDAAVIDGVNDITQVFAHIHEAATKFTDAKWADRLERLKADYESRLSRLAAESLPTTETGGRATGGVVALPALYGPDGLPTDAAMEAVRQGRIRPSELGRS